MRRFFERLVKFWIVWPLLFIAGCVSFAIGVFNDSTALQIVGTLTFMLMLVLMAVVLVAALVLRHWGKAIATVLSVALCLCVGFITMFAVGVGQHHAPKYQLPEEPDTLEIEAPDTLEIDSVS